MDAAAGSDDSLKEELARLREENRALRAASKEDNAALAGLRAALEGAPARAAAWCPTVPAPDAGLGPAEVKRMVTTNLPTEFGTFQIMIFQSGSKHARCDRDGEIALVYGGLENVQREGGAAGGGGALVRIHSSCFTGDVLGSHRCDCGEQLQTSMQLVANHGCGVVVYLHQEGRGIGLLQKLKAYNLQETGLDTLDANLALGHPADAREYKTAVAILTDLGINTVKLLTNNPTKVTEMEAAGEPFVLGVVLCVPVRFVAVSDGLACGMARADGCGARADHRAADHGGQLPLPPGQGGAHEPRARRAVPQGRRGRRAPRHRPPVGQGGVRLAGEGGGGCGGRGGAAAGPAGGAVLQQAPLPRRRRQRPLARDVRLPPRGGPRDVPNPHASSTCMRSPKLAPQARRCG